MSYSLNHNPEMELALRKQRSRATISSLLISILSIALLFVLLAIFLIPSLNLSQSDVIAYQAPATEKEEIQQTEVNTNVQRKPSAPSQNSSRVIAANTASAVAIPVPEVTPETPTVAFGDGDDFGDGWGSGGGGGGGGGTTFFGVASEANRVAFVIDYSGSMAHNGRVDIMKKELQDAVGDLTAGTEFQMIFFAGPVWVAGSEILGSSNPQQRNVIKNGEETFEWSTGNGAHAFRPKGKMQTANWIKIPEIGFEGDEIIKDAKKIIRETPLVYGTRWKFALEMALEMQPPPQVIYFMTDGATGGEAMQVARTAGAQAKTLGTTIHTVAMMQPDANEAMFEIAKRTGGTFTIVEENNKRRVVTELPKK